MNRIQHLARTVALLIVVASSYLGAMRLMGQRTQIPVLLGLLILALGVEALWAVVRWISLLLFPYMPSKATEIWEQLGLDGTPERMWADELVWGKLGAGTQTNPGVALFPRLEPPAQS